MVGDVNLKMEAAMAAVDHIDRRFVVAKAEADTLPAQRDHGFEDLAGSRMGLNGLKRGSFHFVTR